MKLRQHKFRALRVGEFQVLSTLDYAQMTTGTIITFPKPSDLNKTKNVIRAKLRIPADRDIHIFLSGGMKFSQARQDGTPSIVDEVFGMMETLKMRVYAVITRKYRQDLLDAPVRQVGSCSGDLGSLISSVCDTTEVGLTQVACLLGYLANGGSRTDLLITALAKVTDFAPLVCGLQKIAQAPQTVTGLTIATVSASLYAVISGLRKDTADRVFEHTLHVCCYIVHVKHELTDIPIEAVNFEPGVVESDILQYLEQTGQDNPFFSYSPDGDPDFEISVIETPPPEAVDTVFETMASFRPIAPLSLREVHGTGIAQHTGGRVVLYLGEVPGDPTSVRVLDPRRPDGSVAQMSIETLAKLAQLRARDEAAAINPDSITEVTAVCFDSSGSMKAQLDDKMAAEKKRFVQDADAPAGKRFVPADTSRMTIASQYLASLSNRLFALRLPTLLGLVQFNSKVTSLEIKSASDRQVLFTPLLADFEDLSKAIVARGDTLLWDAINQSLENLLTERRTGRYKRIQFFRILVFSDGVDSGSGTDKVALAQRLIRERVVVDSVHLTLAKTSNDLTRLSHITGGYAFQPTSAAEGLKLFEKEAFLSLGIRGPPGRLSNPDSVTPAMFEGTSDAFDDPARLFPLPDPMAHVRMKGLETPKYRVSQGPTEPSDRVRRIVAELKPFIITPQPDIQVFVVDDDVSEWRVYVKAPDGSFYAGKWWYLMITFPPLYPDAAPTMRFITIPYHMNVSADGFLCFDMLTQRYEPTTTILALLKGAQAVLARPDRTQAVQVEKQWNFQYARAEYERDACASVAAGLPNVDFITGLRVKDEPGFGLADDGNPVPVQPAKVFAEEVHAPDLKIIGTMIVGAWTDDDIL
jgi:ubiquitin-protein ligase